MRTWGLILNMLANIVALYGLSQVLAGDGGWPVLLLGVICTIILIGVCAIPTRDPASK